MKLEELQSMLLGVARELPPNSVVPYGFEKRIMARLRELAGREVATFWAQMLWRAAVPSVLIMLCASLWFWLGTSAKSPPDLGAELEEVVFGPAYAAIEVAW